MIESFKNYCAGTAISSSNPVIVIPSGLSGSNAISRTYPSGISWTDDREINSFAQIHSIYISLKSDTKIQGIDRYNPANFAAFNLYIKNSRDDNYKFHIVHDGRIVPGSPFFIEKNITLEPSQYLVLECPQDSWDYDMDTKQSVKLNQSNNKFLEISASVVLIPNSN